MIDVGDVDVQSLFREYVRLERKRVREGTTPEEHRRLCELGERLHKRLSVGPPGGSERRTSVRTVTRIVAEFRTPDDLQRAIIRNLSGTGVFVSTAAPPEIGTELALRVRVASSGRVVDLPGVVVSRHVGDGFSTSDLGMGVRFRPLDELQQSALDDLRLHSVLDDEGVTEDDADGRCR